ncbi:MAG: hypothetical protein ACE5OP_13560 [Candidatus Glassbacteria bacterium]
MNQKTMKFRVAVLGFVLGIFWILTIESQAQTTESEGTGILETDDISIVLEGEGVWIRITPIDDSILKYCTDDTRKMYTSILKSHTEIPEDLKGRMFLVLFQGRKEPETYFEPTELEILHQGNRFRPVKIVPHTSTFDKRVLKFYGTSEMAIYIFPPEIDLEFPITFRYRSLENTEWEQILVRVKDAKAKY